MTTKPEDSFASTVTLVCTVAAIPVGIVTWSWACWLTWGWFAAVISPSLPILSYAQCVALRALLAPWRVSTSDRSPKRTPEGRAKAAIGDFFLQVFSPPLVVAIAFLIHLIVHLPAEVKP